MKVIYVHEYTCHKTDIVDKIGIREIRITVVTTEEEPDRFKMVQQALEFFDNDLNIIHSIKMKGYQQSEKAD